MVLKLDIRTKLFSRSDRVKSVDYHPHEPWVLTALYNGKVVIWNWEAGIIVKSFAIGDAPARCAKFIARKNWFIVGTDDNFLRVFNYNTGEKVATIEAHFDYIRSIYIHPTRPFVISCSDDMSIKLWDWEAAWKCINTFEGHSHYVMCVAFNPKDANTFASASLDGTVKMWTLGSGSCSTFKAHEKGVNCLDFYLEAEKPYLVTGADDCLVKVWDYQSKACVASMAGHSSNVNTVAFHPDLPLILSGAEDGTLRFWHATTFRFEHCYNYGLERVWAICSANKGLNQVAVGFDEGIVCLQIGKQEPAISMDANGKVIWARQNEIVSTSIKQPVATSSISDGERIAYPVKELGHCELFAQTLQHSPNGRFVVVCGDGEYIIYTALAWRNKAFGKALDFVWAAEGNEYAIRAADGTIRVFRNFEEENSHVAVACDALFGGKLIGARCGEGENSVLCFYSWDSLELVRQIDIHALNVVWNSTGDLVAIVGKDSCFLLKYNAHAKRDSDEAFEVVGEIGDVIYSGHWISRDAFTYATCNRICYWIGGQNFTIAHCDSTLFIIGYFSKEGKIYAVDKEVEFFSFTLCHHVIDYQSAVIEGDLEGADQILPLIASSHLGKVALFMESAGHLLKAFEITPDLEHKFELALAMRELKMAKQVIEEQTSESCKEIDASVMINPRQQPANYSPIQPKWRQLGDLALEELKFALAEEAYWAAKDYSSLLLMYAASKGPRESLVKLSKYAFEAGLFNVAFAAAFTAADHKTAFGVLIESKQYCEAAAYARTWGLGPSFTAKALKHWNEKLQADKHPLTGKVIGHEIDLLVENACELSLE
jgi:coatomer subunit beta'